MFSEPWLRGKVCISGMLGLRNAVARLCDSNLLGAIASPRYRSWEGVTSASYMLLLHLLEAVS